MSYLYFLCVFCSNSFENSHKFKKVLANSLRIFGCKQTNFAAQTFSRIKRSVNLFIIIYLSLFRCLQTHFQDFLCTYYLFDFSNLHIYLCDISEIACIPLIYILLIDFFNLHVFQICLRTFMNNETQPQVLNINIPHTITPESFDSQLN